MTTTIGGEVGRIRQILSQKQPNSDIIDPST